MNIYQNTSPKRSKIKRIIFPLCLAVLVTACFISLNLSAVGNSTEGSSFSWSPTTWDFYEVYSPTAMTFKAEDIRFSDRYLRSFPVPFFGEYAPTFDFTFKADNGNAFTFASSYWATNLKSPAHDLDDDEPANGYYEEAEVTGTGYEEAHIVSGNVVAIDYIDTGKDYYYYQNFSKSQLPGSHSGDMYFNMQRSCYLIEWQAMDYDLLEKEYFSYYVKSYGYDLPDEKQIGESRELPKVSFASVDKEYAYEAFSNLRDSFKVQDTRMLIARTAAEIGKIQIPWFTSEPANHQNAVNDLMAELKNTRRHVERISNDLDIKYVYGGITFDEPLQLDDLYLFLSRHDIRIDRFEGYALDGDEIASFGGSALDGDDIDMVRVESLVPANAEIKGIYAIWGWLPAARLDAIDNSMHVLALDVRAFEIHFLAWLHYDLTEVPAIDYEFDDLYWAIKQWEIDKNELKRKILKDPVEIQ